MTVSPRSALLAGTIALVLAACGQSEPPASPPPPQVAVVSATPQTVPLQRELSGRLSSFRSSDVRARVAGVVLKRSYEEGSEVKEGQVLFQIDPAPLQAALSASQAQLASAQASYANATTTAKRARELAPQKFVSQSDLDNAEAAERSAAAAVQQARANVESARINLDFASVRAPISGRAGNQQVTEGALVGQGEATLLTTVDQIDPLYVNFALSVSELDQLRRAQGNGDVALQGQGKATVQVVLSDGSVFNQTGTLDFSGVTVDPATGAVSMRALLPNPEKILLPGTFVTLKATFGDLNNAFLVPQAAIQRDANGAYAMVVGKDGNVVRKAVTTLDMQGGNWLIGSGLETGDQVIVAGLQKVQEGAPAVATPWSPDGAAATPAPTNDAGQ